MRAHWAVALSFFFLMGVRCMSGQTPVKSDSVISYWRTADGVDFHPQHGTLNVRLCTDSMVHVTYRTGDAADHPQPWIAKTSWPRVAFQVADDANHNIVLSTSRIRIVAERDSSALVFEDEHGNVLARESASRSEKHNSEIQSL